MRLIDCTQRAADLFHVEHSGYVMMAVDDDDEDEVYGFGGYYVDRGRVILWCNIRPGGRAHPRVILRAARALIEKARELNMPIQAGADERVPGSSRLLDHLGFKHVFKGVYQWTAIQ